MKILYLIINRPIMTDPLSEIISLLQPRAPISKRVEASGPFHVRRDNVEDVFYCMLLSGRACLEVDGLAPLELNAGDFVLIPAVSPFSYYSLDPAPPKGLISRPVLGDDGIVRIGPPVEKADVQQIIGYCTFASPDADLLVSLLPERIVVSGEERLETLTGLLRDEARSERPARDVIVEHLLQVLLIEAFRSSSRTEAPSGLLRGLADARISPALRAMHATPQSSWNVSALANTAGLSRSAFYTRFNRLVGMAPMSYLLNWRMTLAKHMLQSGRLAITEVSEKVGYASDSAFNTAFTRHVGTPPGRFARTVA